MQLNSDAILAFANGLEVLRIRAHSPSFRELEKRTGFSSTALNDAVRGRTVPTYDTARALVEAFGESWEEWLPAWKAARDQADHHKEAKRTATVIARTERSAATLEPIDGRDLCWLRSLLNSGDTVLYQNAQRLINAMISNGPLKKPCSLSMPPDCTTHLPTF